MVINRWRCISAFAAALVCSAPSLEAATIYVAAGGNLQQALDSAKPGDTILLAERAEFVGNFVLPVKTGTAWITLRSAAPDSVLPPAGVRIKPSQASLLARVRSPNTLPALRTAAGAHHWDIRYLEFPATQNGSGDIIRIGDGSSAQNTLAKVPQYFVLDHLYVHGDRVYGQKRGIALNAAHVTIRDSHVADCKGVGQDTQAIGGWNGPGPYTIENNYLEGAGENVMFGGSDPAIPNLVADGIVFRRNYLSRPMAWRDPVIATPAGVTASAVTGGSLPAGVYGYRVIARGPVGGTTGRSTASAEVVATTTATGAVRVRWTAVAGATEYRVYGRTRGAQAVYWRVTTTELVDTGATGTTEAVPTSAGTMWTVKNLFELKSARNVVIENNIFENHWKESQAGYAIVLTPRNSGGACTWCVVENVRFSRNLVRNVSAGINLTGYDALPNATRQSVNITVEQNVFTLTTALGGNGYFMQIGDEPRAVTVAHNTIDSNGASLINTYGGTAADPREIHEFQMIANAARHGSYGMTGPNFPWGNGVINAYYVNPVVAANYLAGAPASRYPVSTLVADYFQNQFVNTAAGDYTMRTGSFLKGAAPDGSDIGADYPGLVSELQGVDTGAAAAVQSFSKVAAAAPVAGLSISCTFLDCQFADGSTAGSSAIETRSWTFGDGSPARETISGSHRFAEAGTYTTTIAVTDVNGLSSSASTTVVVASPNVAPTAAFTASCADLLCTFTDWSADADGTVSAWAWTSAGGASSAASPTFTFPAPGTYPVVLAVADDDGAMSTVTQPVTVTRRLHSGYTGATLKWTSQTGTTQYWSADVTVAVHGAGEAPIAGATVTAAWSGALAKAVTCVTGTSGTCTFKSGTLSYLRTTATLTVSGVAAPNSAYDPAGNHDQAGVRSQAFTLHRP